MISDHILSMYGTFRPLCHFPLMLLINRIFSDTVTLLGKSGFEDLMALCIV